MRDRTYILDEIRALTHAPFHSGLQAELEHALTAGYAEALALEAAKHRLERRLADAAASFARRAAHPDDLAALGGQLEESEGRVRELRAALVALKARFDELRAAA